MIIESSWAKSIIQRFVNDHKTNYHILFKKKPNIFEYIRSSYDGDRFAIQIYRYLHGNHIGKCENCNKQTAFIGVIDGFRRFCSPKCQSRVMGSKLMSMCKDVLKEKYGTDRVHDLDAFKKGVAQAKQNGVYKRSVSKIKQTKMLRYGNENWNNTEKRKNTKLEMYGDPYYSNPDKWRDTMINKYGMLASPDTIQKLRDNWNNGVINIPKLSDEQIKRNVAKSNDAMVNKIRDKTLSRIPENIELLEEFRGIRRNGVIIRYDFRCKNCGNVFQTSFMYPDNFVCRRCNPLTRSSHEKELCTFLDSIGITDYDVSDRITIAPYELDVLVKSKNVGIEINGLLYHSYKMGRKSRSYHQMKHSMCEDRGIHLLQFWDYDWNRKKDKCLNIIKSALGVYDQKLYARECEIVLLDKSISGRFIAEYHMQGYVPSSVEIGLMYSGALVMVMTFRKDPTNKTEWEINRMVSKHGVLVVGGAAKIFSHFVKTYDPKSIKSYSNNMWHRGNVYKNLGFSMHSITPPNYFYTNTYADMYSRQSFQKHKLAKKLEIFDPSKSEWDNMQLNGYDKVYDAGNKLWIRHF